MYLMSIKSTIQILKYSGRGSTVQELSAKNDTLTLLLALKESFMMLCVTNVTLSNIYVDRRYETAMLTNVPTDTDNSEQETSETFESDVQDAIDNYLIKLIETGETT